TNGKAIKIKAYETFDFGNERYLTVPVLDMIYWMNDLAEEMNKAGKLHREFLSRVQDSLLKTYGIQLVLGEVDEFRKELGKLLDPKKKGLEDSTDAMPNLPGFTASAPSI